jgi:hypothetical protein
VIPVDGPDGTAKMSKDDLLARTAENALGSIHSLSDTADFASDDYIVLDGAINGPRKMAKDDLLKETAQKALEKADGEDVKITGTFLRAVAVDSKYSVDATSAFRVCSDNLNQFPYLNASGTSNTVDFTVNPDGSVKINGTATGGHALFYLNSNVAGGGIMLPAGVYSTPFTQTGVIIQVCKVGTSTDISSSTTDGRTFTLTELTRVYIRIRVANGTAVSNLIVYPMICRGKYCGKYTAPLGAEHSAGLGVIKQSGYVNFISTTSDELSVSYKAPLEEVQKPIYIQKKADVVRVFSRIKKEYDLCIEFCKQGGLVDGEPVGGNQLFDFCRWYYLKRKFGCISTNLDNAVQIQINGTDYFGPYKVFAVNNIDGDLPSSDDFTGGNHQYNNQGSGSTATARCASITLDVDGATDVGEEYNGFADKIVIHWTNYVQATNTKKADGTGREVLREDYEMSFDGVKFVVKNAITALEAIKITTYYGLQGQQFPTISGSYMLYYEGSKTTRAAVRSNISGNCGDKNCRIIKQVGNAYAKLDTLGGVKMPSYDIEMTAFDLGDFSNVESVNYSAHCSSGKVYYNLIARDEGIELAANDVLRFVGGYRFYDSGLD